MRTAGKRFKDPWMSAGGPGEYGHPKRNWGPREVPEDLFDRAERALTFGQRDHRLARLLARFSKMFEW